MDQSTPVRLIDPRLANRRAGGKGKGPRPQAWEALADNLGVETVGQLLRHYPRRYIDRSKTVPMGDLQIGQVVTVIGKVKTVASRLTRRRQTMITVVVYDGTGLIELLYFNQPWVKRTYEEGMEVAVSGEVKSRVGTRRFQMANFDVESLQDEGPEQVHTGRIIPVHRATEGVTSRTVRELVHRALQRLSKIVEPLPKEVIAPEVLLDEDTALRWIHFPEDEAALGRARDRLKFDELFALELGVAYRKRRIEREAEGVAHEVDGGLTGRFVAGLPFVPTAAQSRAMKEIGSDMAAARPMNRLLQGDVGSGKTVVALYAAMVAVQSGHQAVIMAPTEVLAGQHVRSVAALLAPVGARHVNDVAAESKVAGSTAQPGFFDQAHDAGSVAAPVVETPQAHGVTFAMLTASVTGKDRVRVLEGAADGTIDLVVGTHALVQEGVEFADLSLAVVDEQHRFGVHQRISLKEKGAHPDVLIMTATPIPRTLALTYYGDLDVSVLDEMPAGRQPVDTRVVRIAAERNHAYRMVRDQVEQGRQAFVVCAAIDEANRLEVKAAEAEAERLQTDVFPDLRIALLHGRMRPAEKDRIMESFRTGDADVLISTTVIEVGVDVPNATVMLVENAERFGLAQLHQLRGRIGRGEHRSYCVLFDESPDENLEARARLDAMVRTTDGFELADEDLRLRGEGTLFDIRQSGMPDLKLAKLADDVDLVKRARERAFALVDADPGLDAHQDLLDLLRQTFSGDAIQWLFHG